MNALKRVPAEGGPSAVLCGVSGQAFGASWGPDGTVVFSQYELGLSEA